MIKYLYFRNNQNDVAMIRTDRLADMTVTSTTDLTLSFYSMVLTRGSATELVLSTEENTGNTIMEAISDEIAFGEDAFIIVADDHNDVYLHSDITALETTLSSNFT